MPALLSACLGLGHKKSAPSRGPGPGRRTGASDVVDDDGPQQGAAPATAGAGQRGSQVVSDESLRRENEDLRRQVEVLQQQQRAQGEQATASSADAAADHPSGAWRLLSSPLDCTGGCSSSHPDEALVVRGSSAHIIYVVWFTPRVWTAGSGRRQSGASKFPLLPINGSRLLPSLVIQGLDKPPAAFWLLRNTDGGDSTTGGAPVRHARGARLHRAGWPAA